MRNNVAYVYQEGDVTYQNINLKADFMRVNMDEKVVLAYGKADSVEGKPAPTHPIFTEGASTPKTMDTITYNLETGKAKIKGVATQEGDGWLIAGQVPAGVRFFRSPRSYNSQLGVALSLLMMAGDEQLALVEAGISRPGEMIRLERMIRPDVVIFTSLGAAHQAHFASLEEKAAEKLLLAKGAGTIIYNGESALLGHMIRKIYGKKELIDAADYPLPVEFADEMERIDAKIVGTFCAAMGYPALDFTKMQTVGRCSHTTVLEVSLDAMCHNLDRFRSKLRPETGVIAMVKAAGYGAGDFEVAQMLHEQGVRYLAVAFTDEGVLLRERGITMPIVVLNADEESGGR